MSSLGRHILCGPPGRSVPTGLLVQQTRHESNGADNRRKTDDDLNHALSTISIIADTTPKSHMMS